MIIRDFLEALLARLADPSDITSIAEPADNTAAVITFTAPGAGYRWVIVFCAGFYTAAPTAQNMTIESPAATFKSRRPMGTTANDLRTIDGEIHGAVNAAVVITLPAAGAAVGSRLYATARKVRERAI